MRPIAVVTTLLGTSAALTTPKLRGRVGAVSSRPASHRLVRTLPTESISRLSALASSTESTESTKGGAVLPGSGITSVAGLFAIPTPEIPTSGPTAGNVVGLYGASFWLGIDGVSSCPQASLRAGVDIFWDEGLQTAVAWYQWYPGQATDFANFTAAPGDTVRITARADGSTGGSATIENLGANGNLSTAVQTATQTFTGQSPALCQSEAAWVIEDFPIAGTPNWPMPLVNFSSITYGDIEVGTNGDGVSKGATGAQLFNVDLAAQGGQLTSCQVLDTGDVECPRVVGGV